MISLSRHTIRLLLTFLVVSTTLLSCQKYSNEDYEGQWQLIEIAESDGTSAQDVKPYQIYWRLQLGLIQIMSTGLEEERNPGEIIARFQVEQGQLQITSVYWSLREADIPLVEAEEFARIAIYGISSAPETFQIIEMNTSRMVLQSSAHRLTFRKF
ncbi:MAG: lipocalin-like domain-containing protein [Bacteroidaceae bacterium]|nr:lipocalin-like domain-containing protein [Bacteroidaceae bacterium]